MDITDLVIAYFDRRREYEPGPRYKDVKPLVKFVRETIDNRDVQREGLADGNCVYVSPALLRGTDGDIPTITVDVMEGYLDRIRGFIKETAEFCANRMFTGKHTLVEGGVILDEEFPVFARLSTDEQNDTVGKSLYLKQFNPVRAIMMELYSLLHTPYTTFLLNPDILVEREIPGKPVHHSHVMEGREPVTQVGSYVQRYLATFLGLDMEKTEYRMNQRAVTPMQYRFREDQEPFPDPATPNMRSERGTFKMKVLAKRAELLRLTGILKQSDDELVRTRGTRIEARVNEISSQE